MKYILLLFSITFHGQVLHHQMISSQGISTKTTNGLIVKQTIGQQSLTGTSGSKEYVVMQGFQQSFWGNYISSSNNTIAVEGELITTYPNPTSAIVNVQFSQTTNELISVSLFDILGRLVYKKDKKSINSILTIDLSILPASEYLLHLNNNDINYYTKIIKL